MSDIQTYLIFLLSGLVLACTPWHSDGKTYSTDNTHGAQYQTQRNLAYQSPHEFGGEAKTQALTERAVDQLRGLGEVTVPFRKNRHAGVITVNPNAGAIFTNPPPHPKGPFFPVQFSNLQTGDIILFSTTRHHRAFLGLYIGAHHFVYASENKFGDPHAPPSTMEGNLDKPAWKDRFIAGLRLRTPSPDHAPL